MFSFVTRRHGWLCPIRHSLREYTDLVVLSWGHSRLLTKNDKHAEPCAQALVGPGHLLQGHEVGTAPNHKKRECRGFCMKRVAEEPRALDEEEPWFVVQ